MWLSKKSTASLIEHLNRVKMNLKKRVLPHLFNSACSNREDKRKGYNTDRALIPTVSSFPPLDSCPPSAMHYKRLIMTVTAPQVCRMLDLLFSSQAFLSLPLTTCTGTQSRTQWHTHKCTHAGRGAHTHTHPPTHTQIPHPHPHIHTHNHNGFLTAAVSAGFWNQREGGYYMNQPHTTVVFAVLWSERTNEIKLLLFDLNFQWPLVRSWGCNCK